MFLSKKQKMVPSGTQTERTLGLELIAQLIVQKFTRAQRKLSEEMQKEVENLSVAGKKMFLILFCLIGIGVSIYVIAENILYKNTLPRALLSPIPISNDVFENVNRNSVIIPKTEFNKIENFKKYIDSLSKSTSGNRIKDSILKFRPLLMDSVNQFVELYQLEEKNKK